jgi:uncharacterized protein (UPF0548 family)
MFLHRKPSEESVRHFISSQRELPFSYSQPGATRAEAAPSGYNVDHSRIKLGDGGEAFQRAVTALRSWKQFDLGWLAIVPPDTAIEVGATVAVRAHTLGFWSLNACRIVYVIDEGEPVKKFGFAYGTLPDHVERGEERFAIEWYPDGSVFYDIYAFSRPQHPLVRLGFPVARKLQQKFVRNSLDVMVKTINSPA